MIPSTENKVQTACNGSLVAFSFPYKIFAQTDLVVTLTDSDGVETVLTISTHYTVAATGGDFENGAVVTTVATYATGNTITLKRVIADTQDSDYINSDTLDADTLENDFDKAAVRDQQIQEELDRCIKIPVSDADASMELPSEDDRPSTSLLFDSSGLPTYGASLAGAVASAAMIPVVEAATLAAARTAMVAQKTITVQTGAPSGGSDGDIIFVREA